MLHGGEGILTPLATLIPYSSDIRVYFGTILIKIWYDQDHKKVSKFAVTK